MLDPERIPTWAPILVGLLVLSLHDLTLQPWTLDDAYITFRYAENLVAGHGPVFNPGERVEGYTNFLWMLLLAGGKALGLAPDPFSKVLGFGLDAAALVMVGLAHRIVGPALSRTTAMLGVILLSTCGIFSKWSMSGMEVPLVTFLSTAAVLLHLRGRQRDDPPGLALAVGLLAALAAMTRPDAGLVLGVISLDRLAGLVRGRGRWSSLVAMTAAFGALFGGFFAWRYGYYGQLLPNTFYVKVGATGDQVLRGLVYLAKGANVAWPFVLVPLAALWLRVEAGLRVVGLLALLHAAYVVMVGGDVFWGYRFWAAYLPLMALASASVLRQLPITPRKRTLFAAFAIATNLWWLVSSRQLNADPVVAPDGVILGAWLAERAPPDALLATNIAGSIPYVSGLRTIDTLGLNDRHIAHRDIPTMGQGRPGHEKGDGAYVLSRKPDYVLFASSRGAIRPKFLGDRELYESEAFHQQYDLHVYQVQPGFRARIYVRRDSAGGKGLRASPVAIYRNPPANAAALPSDDDEADALD